MLEKVILGFYVVFNQYFFTKVIKHFFHFCVFFVGNWLSMKTRKYHFSRAFTYFWATKWFFMQKLRNRFFRVFIIFLITKLTSVKIIKTAFRTFCFYDSFWQKNEFDRKVNFHRNAQKTLFPSVRIYDQKVIYHENGEISFLSIFCLFFYQKVNFRKNNHILW